MLFDLPDFHKGAEMEVGTPSLNDFPPLTDWQPVCKTPCLQLNYIPSMKEYFLNHWRISMFSATLVSFIILTSYIVYMEIHTFYLKQTASIKIIMTFLMLLFIYTYYSIILEGPGYLPFYFPLKIGKRKGDHADYLAGVVSTQMQETYVKRHKKFNRVRYFDTARRYVIRPDHFCGWTGTFIGKKNHKLFYLFNLYGFFYISLFNYFSYYSIRIQFNLYNANTVALIVSIFYFIAGILFVLMTGGFSVTSLYNFAVNATQFEIMSRKRRPEFNHGCLQNFEDVCGPRKNFWLWLVPIGAFHGIPTEELLYDENNAETAPFL